MHNFTRPNPLSTTTRDIQCNISIIEYGISYSLRVPKEPTYIEDTETRNLESLVVAQYIHIALEMLLIFLIILKHILFIAIMITKF